MIKAEIVADSSNEFGNRITTMIVTFPRFILAELNTHRMFSRNSASSRAIPFEKMLKSVEENPFIPIAWQIEHKGMQGSEYVIDYNEIKMAESQWLLASEKATQQAKALNDNCITKQLCNRLLEPFMWHTVLITATGWENFFALRCPQYITGYKLGSPEAKDEKYHRSWKDVVSYLESTGNLGTGDIQAIKERSLLERLQTNKGQAEIHMMALAEAIWDAYNESTPKELNAGEWHIPFGDNIDDDKLEDILHGPHRASYIRHDGDKQQAKVEIATAMCARVSYTVVDEKYKGFNYENDLKLHDRLAESGHWSPFEHCAKSMTDDEYKGYLSGRVAAVQKTLNSKNYYPEEENMGWCGNFRGFIQYRKMFSNENITK